MNVYNEAHNLARAISESDECRLYAAAREKVNANPELTAIVNDLQEKQIKLQMAQISGTPDSDMQSKMMEISQIMMRDPVIMDYFQNQMRMSLMLQDVYKIINDAAGISSDFGL